MSLDERSRYLTLQITKFETDQRNRLNANAERNRPTNTGADFNLTQIMLVVPVPVAARSKA